MNAFAQTELDVKTATILFRKGDISLDRLAIVLWPLICKVSSMAANRMKMDIADDIATSTWLAFQQKGVHQWDESNAPLGAYLTVIARNLAILMYRDQMIYATANNDEEGENVDTTELVETSATFSQSSTDLSDEIDKAIAVGAIRKKLLYAGNDKETTNNKSDPQKMTPSDTFMPGVKIGKISQSAHHIPFKKEKNSTYNLDEKQSELANIYKKFHEETGMTQAIFAEKLNIGSARLASYLYGRTSSVPDHVMDIARELLESTGVTSSKFSDFTMHTILENWATTLGIESFDDAKIAPLIGVNISTVCRWRNNECRPSNIELIRYEAMVGITAERINKAAQKK